MPRSANAAAQRLVVVSNEDQTPEPQARPEELRLLEAILFASPVPLDETQLARRLPAGVDVREALVKLQTEYATRGVNLIRLGKKWAFRTAADLAWLMTRLSREPKKLSRAAIETLAIIAYHQPVTRAEVEESAASRHHPARSTCCSRQAGSGYVAAARRRAVR